MYSNAKMLNKIVIYKNYSLILLLLVLVCLFLIYLKTMMPTISFHDPGELQTVVPTVNVAHPTGFPTYVLLGKVLIMIIPFGQIAWRVTFLSTLYSLGVLFLLGCFIRLLTKDIYFYLAGVLLLGLCKPFWDYAGIADTHTLNRLFIFILLNIFLLFYQTKRKWFFLLFCLTFGLGLGDHLLLLFALPGFVFWTIAGIFQGSIILKLNTLIYGMLLFFLGLSVYLLLPLREFFGPLISVNYSLQNWPNFIKHVSGADFQGLMLQGDFIVLFNNMIQGLDYLSGSVTLVGILIGLVGIYYGMYKDKVIFITLSIIFISFLFFSTNYPTSDPTRYYLSYISIYAIFICFGLVKIGKMLSMGSRILTFFIILLIPLNFLLNSYQSVDKSNQDNAFNYSKKIFSEVLPNSLILSWWNYSTPLWYREYVLNERKDIKISNIGEPEWINYVKLNISNRPIYIVEEDAEIAGQYMVTKEAGIFRVLAKP